MTTSPKDRREIKQLKDWVRRVAEELVQATTLMRELVQHLELHDTRLDALEANRTDTDRVGSD